MDSAPSRASTSSTRRTYTAARDEQISAGGSRWRRAAREDRLATKSTAVVTDGRTVEAVACTFARRATTACGVCRPTHDLTRFTTSTADTRGDEIWQARIARRSGQGAVRGSSNFAAGTWSRPTRRPRAAGLAGAGVGAELYNLNARTVELEGVAGVSGLWGRHHPWSPLGGGLLGGDLRKVTEGRRAGERVQTLVEDNRDKLQAWESLAMSSARSLPTWRWRGCSTSGRHRPDHLTPHGDQLRRAYHALEITLEHGHARPRSTRSPGPGGAAPEAYAW